MAEILDIRQDVVQSTLKQDILDGLRRPAGQKELTSMVLYDEAGLRLFEEITYLDDYYLTNQEISVLRAYSAQLADQIRPDSMIIELGSGNLRKVRIILDAIEHERKHVDYYALDLDLPELERTLSQIPKDTYKYVTCRGLHGTFEDGKVWLQHPDRKSVPKCVMFLGSSIGNFSRPDAATFLAGLADSLSPSDSLIVGIDNCQDPAKVFKAYNDSKGVTHEFYRNGLQNVNRLVGMDVFQKSNWDVWGEYDQNHGRHVATISPKAEVALDGLHFSSGEKIRLEWAHKYSHKQQRELFEAAGLHPRAVYSNESRDYSLSMLAIPFTGNFSLDPKVYAKNPVPSLDEWNQLWATWDLVTRIMVPDEESLLGPIKLRDFCLFYLGHVLSFLKDHLARATKGQLAESPPYSQGLVRGIDVDIERPELFSAYSKISPNWPMSRNVLASSDKLRQRITELYKTGTSLENGEVGHALWLGFEHEAMHLETLLYTLVHSDKMLPPPGPKPQFAILANQAAAAAKPRTWVTIPPRTITVGMGASGQSNSCSHYGWDNEKPARERFVSSFEASTRAITNGEYAEYLESCGVDGYPASWELLTTAATTQTNRAHIDQTGPRSGGASKSFIGDKAVKTVYGAVPLEYALDWPLIASYSEIEAYAKWKDGRIPTAEEAQSIYDFAEEMDNAVSSNVAKTIPAVNGHLSNDGVEETPPSRASLHANLAGSNTGFHAFHPMPVSLLSEGSDKPAGRAGLGGVWEWTSSALEWYPGFEAMEQYPGYTANFFDGKHNIVLGGSWATHPRITGRKSFVNWFPRNYQYAWCGARLVRDIPSNES